MKVLSLQLPGGEEESSPAGSSKETEATQLQEWNWIPHLLMFTREAQMYSVEWKKKVTTQKCSTAHLRGYSNFQYYQ